MVFVPDTQYRHTCSDQDELDRYAKWQFGKSSYVLAGDEKEYYMEQIKALEQPK